MTKKIGIIGFGEMGKRHGLEFREATKGNIEICGVVEPDDVMYQRGCEWNDLPDIPRFDTVADLLKHACPDGVIISSPNFTHLDNLIKLENDGSAHSPCRFYFFGYAQKRAYSQYSGQYDIIDQNRADGDGQPFI